MPTNVLDNFIRDNAVNIESFVNMMYIIIDLLIVEIDLNWTKCPDAIVCPAPIVCPSPTVCPEPIVCSRLNVYTYVFMGMFILSLLSFVFLLYRNKVVV